MNRAQLVAWTSSLPHPSPFLHLNTQIHKPCQSRCSCHSQYVLLMTAIEVTMSPVNLWGEKEPLGHWLRSMKDDSQASTCSHSTNPRVLLAYTLALRELAVFVGWVCSYKKQQFPRAGPQIWKRYPGRKCFVLSGLCKIWGVWLFSYTFFVLAQLYSQCCGTPPLSTIEIRRAFVNPQKQRAAHTHLPSSLYTLKSFLELGNLQTTGYFPYKSFISAELRQSKDVILSDDSEVGAFIPLMHLYIILTQQNRSTFFFLFSKLPRGVFFNVDSILHILMLIVRKAPPAGKALCPGIDIKKGVPVWQKDLAQSFWAWSLLGPAAHALRIGILPCVSVSIHTHGFSSAWCCVP